MSDFLNTMAESIKAETPAPAPAPEGAAAEGLTAEKVSSMIDQALKSNDEKVRSLMEEAIAKNIEKLASYKPEEKPLEEEKEDG